MLQRLKSASPKLRIILGLWLAVEVLSLPFAAGLAMSFAPKDEPLMVAALDNPPHGQQQFLVTHSEPFDVAIHGVTGEIEIKVEGTRAPLWVETRCAQFLSDAPRTIKTITEPRGDRSESVFVTIFYSDDQTPEVSFETDSQTPPALPCQTVS